MLQNYIVCTGCAKNYFKILFCYFSHRFLSASASDALLVTLIFPSTISQNRCVFNRRVFYWFLQRLALQKIVSCLKEMLHGAKKCLILGKNVSFANFVLSVKFLIAEEVFFTTCKSPEFFKLDQEELK